MDMGISVHLIFSNLKGKEFCITPVLILPHLKISVQI